MKCRKSISVAAFAALCLAAHAAEKRLIAYGWDTALLTPNEILANAERFDGSPFDGLGVTLPGNDRVMTDAGWTKERFAAACETLRAAVCHPSLRESLLMLNLAPQVRLAWTDDAAWARAAANLRAAGAIAKAAGLRGIMGDIEDYWKTRQFLHREDEMPYAEAAALARRRGQEVYRGLFEEHPDMLLLTFMYFTLDRAYSISADPAATMREKGDLLPAFLNGMLDVMPEGVRVVDGNETSGYVADALRRDFHAAASVTRAHILPLVAPENRDRYRAQVLVGFGLYLDGYVMTDASSPWYLPPKDGSRLERLRANLDQALEACDGYVWIYGERRTFVDWKGVSPKTGFLAQAYGQGTWEDALPGFGDMIRCVKDPGLWMAENFARKVASGELVNLVPDATVHFPRIDSVFVEDVRGMQDGDYYGIRVHVPNATNAHSIVYWKTSEGKWNFPLGGNRVPLALNATTGLLEGSAFVRAPGGDIGVMGLQVRAPSVREGEEKDKVFVGVYRITFDKKKEAK